MKEEGKFYINEINEKYMPELLKTETGVVIKTINKIYTAVKFGYEYCIENEKLRYEIKVMCEKSLSAKVNGLVAFFDEGGDLIFKNYMENVDTGMEINVDSPQGAKTVSIEFIYMCKGNGGTKFLFCVYFHSSRDNHLHYFGCTFVDFSDLSIS